MPAARGPPAESRFPLAVGREEADAMSGRTEYVQGGSNA
jgi:hypothetical protein